MVLVPQLTRGMDQFSDGSAPVSALDVARLGYVALTFDPAGLGESWGEDDLGGLEHQDNVAVAVDHLARTPGVDPTRVGILSVASGSFAAVGAVAHHQAAAAWLVDWEGPCDRETLRSDPTVTDALLGVDDSLWWRDRAPVRGATALTCGYLRLQAEQDHARPGEVRHARRMLHAVATSPAPWFRINHHPPGEVPPRPRWLRAGRRAARSAILDALRALRPVS